MCARHEVNQSLKWLQPKSNRELRARATNPRRVCSAFHSSIYPDIYTYFIFDGCDIDDEAADTKDDASPAEYKKYSKQLIVHLEKTIITKEGLQESKRGALIQWWLIQNPPVRGKTMESPRSKINQVIDKLVADGVLLVREVVSDPLEESLKVVLGHHIPVVSSFFSMSAYDVISVASS